MGLPDYLYFQQPAAWFEDFDLSVVPFKKPADQSAETAGKRKWIRFVTAASLFDGHDAAINIMRRILQSSGAEVIHLAHNRSVQDIVEAAVQEDVDAIAISSYQGGHIEYFKYLVDRLRELDASHIKIFGGGGGVIIPAEIEELHAYGGDSNLFSCRRSGYWPTGDD